MDDETHPEDRKNLTLLCARLRDGQVDMTWPDDLARARYMWRRLGTTLARVEYASIVGWDVQDPMSDEPEILAEVHDDVIHFEITRDLPLARMLLAGLDEAITEAEWRRYVDVTKVQEKMREEAQRRVVLGEATPPKVKSRWKR